MKVFEYNWKTGKGKEITDVKFGGCGCIIGRFLGYPVHEHFSILTYKNGVPEFTQEGEKLTADDFKVDAILFCTGRYNDGSRKDVWEWMIVPTKKLVDKAIKRNIRQTGLPHNWEGKKNGKFIKR